MTMKRYVLGADPGKKGGIVLVSTDYDPTCIHKDDVILFPMKSDKEEGINLQKVAAFLAPYVNHIDLCVQEDVHALGFSSASGTFLFGYYSGMLWATLSLLCPNARHIKVSPRDWQAVMWKPEHVTWEEAPTIGGKRKKDTKKTSSNAAAEVYPGISFMTSKISKYDHDGCVDAALIAQYGLRYLRGTLPVVEKKTKKKRASRKKKEL